MIRDVKDDDPIPDHCHTWAEIFMWICDDLTPNEAIELTHELHNVPSKVSTLIAAIRRKLAMRN